LVSAQIANAVFAAVTTVAFIGLASCLAAGDRRVVLCAAIVILLQPHLLELRPSIVRDNGYLAFFALTLYLVARDVVSPRRITKIFVVIAIAAAGLFRIEGFFLAALVPIYYVAVQPGNRNRPWLIFAIVLAGIMVVIPGLLLWTSGSFFQWMTGHFEFGALASRWAGISDTVGARLYKLKYDFLFPAGSGNGWGAYVGMTLGIATVNIVRAITIPLAILTVFAFFPKRLMPRSVNGFVLWFAFGQLPVLLVFTFVMLLLDKRYAVALALVLDIPLAFLLAETIRQWRPGSAARIFLPATAIVLIAVATFAFPRSSKLGYLKEAGQWIGREMPSNARILTNDSRIAYFSGRPYGEAVRTWAYGWNAAPTDAELADFDCFAFKVEKASDLPAAVANVPDKKLVQTFAGKDGENVFVYVHEHVAAPAGGDAR
jgi:hypothetical protein